MDGLFFYFSPSFFIGLLVLIIYLINSFRKSQTKNKLSTSVASILLFYYLFFLLQNIVGIPYISDLIRIITFGENIFNPNIHLIPFGEGIDIGFVLNIFVFIPFGLLVPFISPTYRSIKRTTFLTFVMSFMIEISQLFTLYRATDINDLIANTLGGMFGILVFIVAEKMSWSKSLIPQPENENTSINILPIVISILSFIIVFFS